MRLHELILNAYSRLVGQVLAQVATVGDKLRNLAADFNRLIEHFSVASPGAVESSARTNALQRVAAEQIAKCKAELLTAMEQALENELHLAATGEIRDVPGKLAGIIRRTSRTLILQMLKQFAQDQAAAALEGRPHDPLFEISQGLREAIPQRLPGCGGRRRMLVTVPERLAPRAEEHLASEGRLPRPTILADDGSDMLACCEVEDQALPQVAAAVLDRRFQAVEAAARLHTRTDVAWAPL